jgi:hypothetical protein
MDYPDKGRLFICILQNLGYGLQGWIAPFLNCIPIVASIEIFITFIRHFPELNFIVP